MNQSRCSVCREVISERFYYQGRRGPECSGCARPRGAPKIVDFVVYRKLRVVMEYRG